MASIDNFHLKKIKRFHGHDFPGLQAQLWYKNKHVADFYDGGYGGDPEISVDADIAKFVLKQFLQLCNKIQSPYVLEELAFYTKSGHGAVNGFVELLERLDNLSKEANNLCKRVEEGYYYYVYLEGVNRCGSGGNYATYEKAKQAAFRQYESQGMHEPMTNLAILKGPFSWNLSLEDYAELHKID